MRHDELRHALAHLTPEQKALVSKIFGESIRIESCVDEFIRHPEHEPFLAAALGLETEPEKNTRAALESSAASTISARIAEESAREARRSADWSRISAIVAVVALAFTIGSWIYLTWFKP